jgi:hypothetical protein
LNYSLHVLPNTSALFVMHVWYRRPGGDWFSAEVNNTRGKPMPVLLNRLDSPDIAPAFKDPAAGAQRFVLRFESADDCVLNLSTAPGRSSRRSSAKCRGRLQHSGGARSFHVDVADVRPNPMYERQRVDEWSRRFHGWILGNYELLFVPVLVPAQGRSCCRPPYTSLIDKVCYMVAFAAWVLVSTRVLLLASSTSAPCRY